MLEQPLAYAASHDGSVFCLKFGYTGVFDGHATRVYYLSTNGTWLDKPYEPPDVNWEAALLHGQEYQATRSSMALRRGVTSLTHTHVDWLHALHVQDALGHRDALPDDAEDEGTYEWRYDGNDGAAFVFSFDKRVVHEIHAVHRDECGNERRTVMKRYPRFGR